MNGNYDDKGQTAFSSSCLVSGVLNSFVDKVLIQKRLTLFVRTLYGIPTHQKSHSVQTLDEMGAIIGALYADRSECKPWHCIVCSKQLACHRNQIVNMLEGSRVQGTIQPSAVKERKRSEILWGSIRVTGSF